MSSLVNFIVGGMLGYLMVRKMANPHTFSSEHDQEEHNHTKRNNGHAVNYVHK